MKSKLVNNNSTLLATSYERKVKVGLLSSVKVQSTCQSAVARCSRALAVVQNSTNPSGKTAPVRGRMAFLVKSNPFCSQQRHEYICQSRRTLHRRTLTAEQKCSEIKTGYRLNAAFLARYCKSMGTSGRNSILLPPKTCQSTKTPYRRTLTVDQKCSETQTG